MTRSVWDSLQAVRVAVLIVFLPVVLYRIWRLVRYPTSIPAIAATVFGVWVWFWMLIFTEPVWTAMPASVHAVSMGGWAPVWMAGCLQIFVIGINGDVSQVWIRRGLCATFAVTGLVLIVVAVAVSQSRVLVSSADMLALTNALLDGGDRGAAVAQVVSSGFLAVVLVQLAWVGFRHADRTPVGVGLGLLAMAAVLQLTAIALTGVWRPLTGGGMGIGGRYVPLLQILPGCAGAALMVVGFAWPPVMLRVQARRELRRLRPLHDALVGMFPGLSPPAESQIRLSDLVFEWVAHVQDGLTILSQRREVPVETGWAPPADQIGRVVEVANWISGQSVSGFSCEWLRPPMGMSDQAWVLAIADAYRNCMETSEVQEVGRERLPVKT
ncbi:hypothetical protein [Mycobacteroides chelonae]|uniref:Uncharacterized protein n=1 Tax=Mycobacteroides chelonae TaxID=1774 RepID=A0A1S1M7X1_MYCCH|nr:hypothetical protein [Mycobacteroides chelonae]OHU78603.1 hypothetical protein BKG84_09525 [Mycobacteroides chelonae]